MSDKIPGKRGFDNASQLSIKPSKSYSNRGSITFILSDNQQNPRPIFSNHSLERSLPYSLDFFSIYSTH